LFLAIRRRGEHVHLDSGASTFGEEGEERGKQVRILPVRRGASNHHQPCLHPTLDSPANPRTPYTLSVTFLSRCLSGTNRPGIAFVPSHRRTGATRTGATGGVRCLTVRETKRLHLAVSGLSCCIEQGGRRGRRGRNQGRESGSIVPISSPSRLLAWDRWEGRVDFHISPSTSST
jgi:hypothetical protein